MNEVVSITINLATCGQREVPYFACHLAHDRGHTIDEFAEQCTAADLWIAQDDAHPGRVILRVVVRHIAPAIIMDGVERGEDRYAESEILSVHGLVRLETINWFLRQVSHNGYWNLFVRFNNDEQVAYCTIDMNGVACNVGVVPYEKYRQNFEPPRLHKRCACSSGPIL